MTSHDLLAVIMVKSNEHFNYIAGQKKGMQACYYLTRCNGRRLISVLPIIYEGPQEMHSYVDKFGNYEERKRIGKGHLRGHV